MQTPKESMTTATIAAYQGADPRVYHSFIATFEPFHRGGAMDVKVIACERENSRFGDYQCNDAMKVRAGAAAGRHGAEARRTAN